MCVCVCGGGGVCVCAWGYPMWSRCPTPWFPGSPLGGGGGGGGGVGWLVQYPLCPLQAFAIVLAATDSKLTDSKAFHLMKKLSSK